MWYTVLTEKALLDLVEKPKKSHHEKLEQALNEAESRGFTFVSVAHPGDGDACYVFTAENVKHRLGNIK